MSTVWESELPSDEKFVALALADFADDDGERIFPSIAYVAWKVGKTERSVYRTIRKLIDAGILTPISGVGGGFKLTVHYRLNESELPQRGPWRPDKTSPLSRQYPDTDDRNPDVGVTRSINNHHSGSDPDPEQGRDGVFRGAPDQRMPPRRSVPSMNLQKTDPIRRDALVTEQTHIHTPSPPDEYGPRKGLEAIGLTMCVCGWEIRLGDGLPSGWHPPRTFTGRQRAAAWGNR